MKDMYTMKEAMDRLGVRGLKSFLRLEHRYPHAFIILKQTKGATQKQGLHLHYDKAAIDRVAEMREKARQGKP